MPFNMYKSNKTFKVLERNYFDKMLLNSKAVMKIIVKYLSKRILVFNYYLYFNQLLNSLLCIIYSYFFFKIILYLP